MRLLVFMICVFLANINLSKGECWKEEGYEIATECHECSPEEKTNNSELCSKTGFMETVYCKKTGKTSRSCENPLYRESRKFWWFEFASTMVAVVSVVMVFARYKALDYEHEERINKQISTL